MVCQNNVFRVKTGYMKIIRFLKIAFITIFGLLMISNANAMLTIVAAENVYGDVAQEIGGPYVSVHSILTNPTQDPHLFSTTPSTAKMIDNANIIIYNGANYDPWIFSLLTFKGQENRKIIDVSTLLKIPTIDNPHIWYFPDTLPLFAAALVDQLSKMDPAHQDYFKTQLKQFMKDYAVIYKKIAELKKQFAGMPVIATEPIYGYMVNYLDLKMQAQGFQINMMNDIPPTISQIKAFENDLHQHKVRVMIYNDQVVNPLTERMRTIANSEGIPVVGISETLPPHLHYIQWMMSELTVFEKALAENQGTHNE